jgi:ubiquitin
MDVWTLGEKYKDSKEQLLKLEDRVAHIEDYLKSLNSKLDLINKASNEKVQDKKSKSSRVRTKRSSSKKS